MLFGFGGRSLVVSMIPTSVTSTGSLTRKVNLVSGRDFPWPCGGHFDGFSDRLQSKLSDRSALRRS